MLLTVFSLSACEDFFDVNESPNSLTAVPGATLLPTIQVELGYTAYGNVSLYTGSFMQYYAGHRGQPLEYSQINFAPSSSDGTWSSLYAGVIENANQLIVTATEEEQLAYAGMAKVLKANAYMILTDLYGDIPFTEANNVVEFITPAYDDQEVVYDGILTMLDEAVADLQADTETNVGSADLIYGGDTDQWIRYANTLKLRALNHLSLVRPGAALAFLNTNPALIESNEDNALVPFFNNTDNWNPRYNFDNRSGREDNAVGATIVDLLVELDDPRLLYYFEPVRNDGAGFQGEIVGNVSGNDQDDSGRNLFSRVGLSLAAADAPVVLASYAEAQFLIAEIRNRNGEAGPAEEAYEAGIEGSLEFHSSIAAGEQYSVSGVEIPEISEDLISDYISQSGVQYNNTLQRIMEQKYIAMYSMPYEAWVDWRRTGFPDLDAPVVNFTQNQLPLRLPYPQLEIDLNRANLEAGPGVPTRNVTIVNDPVWWDAN